MITELLPENLTQHKSIPYLITFPKIGEGSIGHISFAQAEHLPFVPKRIYWTYGTPEDVMRGNLRIMN
jgi:WxcM-like protein